MKGIDNMNKYEEKIVNEEIGKPKKNYINATKWTSEIKKYQNITINPDYLLANLMFLGFIRRPIEKNIKGYVPTKRGERYISVEVTTIKNPDKKIEYSSTPVFNLEFQNKAMPIILYMKRLKEIAKNIK